MVTVYLSIGVGLAIPVIFEKLESGKRSYTEFGNKKKVATAVFFIMVTWPFNLKSLVGDDD